MVASTRVDVFGPEHAELYELHYRSRGKSWADEAKAVTREVRDRLPTANSLLDVACGTGAQLAEFRSRFRHVEGVELAPAMRELAVRRLPGVVVHPGDMRGFALGRTFDVVTCLFTSIAFLTTVADLRVAIRTMADHLADGGVLVVEPWWFPVKFLDGYVGEYVSRTEGRTVARYSHSTRRGRATRMEVRWVVTDAAGEREYTSVETLTLFERDEYVAAFEAAGCPVDYLDGWFAGRGVFVGRRRPS